MRWVTTTDSASTTVQPSASASARPDSGIQTAGRPNAGSVVGMPGQLTHGVARVHRQMVTGHHAAARNFRAAHAHDVLVRVQADVVADADGRDDHAELGGDLAADRADAGEQRAAGLLVDERHQAEADRQLERVERERVERGVARGGQLRLVGRARRPRPSSTAPRCWRVVGLLAQRPADGEEQRRR